MIVELLHKVAGMELEEHQYRPRPSMAGPDRCLRQMVYQRMDAPPDKAIPDRLKHIFNDGQWHEELTREWINKTNFKLDSEQLGVTLPLVFDWLPRKMYECSICHQQICEADLHGHIDGVLTNILKEDFLWEHKGLSSYTFDKYWARKEYPEDYFCQCAIYLKGLQALNPQIRTALLMIKNKNSSGFLEYQLSYDADQDTLTANSLTLHTGESVELKETRPKIIAGIIEKFRAVENCANDQVLPDRPYDYDDWHCQYCRWQETCWEGYTKELESLVDEAELEPQWGDTLRFHQELAAQIKELKDQQEDIKNQILVQMLARWIKKGRAGEYCSTLVIQDRKDIDWDHVPPSLSASLDYYRKSKPVVFPKITKLAPKKEKKGK